MCVGATDISGVINSEYRKRFPGGDHYDDSVGDDARAHAYFYPRVQYKVIRGGPIIAAVGEGCQLLWEIYRKLDELNDGQPHWKIVEKRLIDRKAKFGLTDRYVKYRFLTPWLALPEEVFRRFLQADDNGRQKMLSKALEGHFRSIAQSLNYSIEGEMHIKTNIKPKYIFQKDIRVAGLFGSFIANFELPSFLGIGKSVSRGFGTVKQV